LNLIIAPILFLAAIIVGLLDLFIFILAILGIINVYNGKAKELPFLGSITLIK
jgi:uncharacterized membrane protein